MRVRPRWKVTFLTKLNTCHRLVVAVLQHLHGSRLRDLNRCNAIPGLCRAAQSKCVETKEDSKNDSIFSTRTTESEPYAFNGPVIILSTATHR